MLKKLFISLIILSALTSEGVMNLPESIFNLYLNLNNVHIWQGEEDAVPVKPQEEPGNSMLYSAVLSNGSFVLSTGSLEKIGLIPLSKRIMRKEPASMASDFPVYLVRVLLLVSLAGIIVISLLLHNRKIIISRSDPSPPVTGVCASF